MQATPDKDFDKLFQEKFQTFEVEPSSAVWRGIASELDKGKKKTFPVFQMIAVAATVLVVLSTGLWLFSPKEKIRLHGKADLVIQDEESGNNVSKPLVKIIDTTKRRLKSSVKIAEPTLAISSKPTAEEKIIVQEPSRLAETPVKEAEPAKPVNITPKEEKPKAMTDQPILAFVGDQSTAPDKKDAEQQRRVKTVGDLVNFVIGKVDPREDKIIQFKNDEEGGSEVSGINLGLLKFKSRNK